MYGRKSSKLPPEKEKCSVRLSVVYSRPTSQSYPVGPTVLAYREEGGEEFTGLGPSQGESIQPESLMQDGHQRKGQDDRIEKAIGPSSLLQVGGSPARGN